MSETRLMRAWGQGCAISLILRLVITVIVFGGCCVFTLLVILLPIDQDYRIYAWLGLLVLFLTTLVAASVAWGVIAIRKRAVMLDTIFLPLGLTGRMYMQNGRQFHGSYRGHSIHIYLSRGPSLQIYLDMPLKTRMGVGRQGALNRVAANLSNKDPLPVNYPGFEELVVYADDSRWGSILMADSQARQAIRNLMAEETASETRSLSITPNAFLLHSLYIPIGLITANTAKSWLDGLCTLAEIAEEMPEPTVQSQESNLERITRTDRNRLTLPVIAITCGIFVVLTICAVAFSVGVILLLESGS